MGVKGGRIEVAAPGADLAAPDADPSIKGKNMARTGKKGELPKKDEKESKKSPAKPAEDEDDEDGDIATPKRDRYGTDDEPL
jgi:hypothetical protein